MDNIEQAAGLDTIDDLAQFIVDTSEEPTEDEDTQNADDDAGEDDDPADDSDDEPESDKPEEQTSPKFKVSIKGDDGTDQEVEVDQKELISGYQRHADYTRKTQELSTREREVTQAVATRLQEGQSHYMQQAQMAQAAVRQLAGLRSADEMAVLAQTDPAQWVQEQQRERAINGVLNQLEQGLNTERTQQQNVQKQQQQQAFSDAWSVLSEAKIDKSALQKIYATVTTKYGIPAAQLSNLYDPKLVLALRDAVAYQELKDKKAAVTKKVEAAPRLPAARQAVPRNEQADKKLSARFSSGKAKLNDLAAYLNSH